MGVSVLIFFQFERGIYLYPPPTMIVSGHFVAARLIRSLISLIPTREPPKKLVVRAAG